MGIALTVYLIVLPAVFLAGVLDAIAGGGGLISVPAYLAAGVPPHLALGTNKFSASFGTAVATARYVKHGIVDLRTALATAFCALGGSLLGARVVLGVDPEFLKYILLVAIPIIALVTLRKTHLGQSQETYLISGRRRLMWVIGGGAMIGFYDGLFGPGTGSFLMLFFVWALRYDFVSANGNTKVVNLSTNIAALVIFLIHGKVSFALGIPAAMCGVVGNWVGSKLVIRRGARLIRPVFFIVLALLLGKTIYDLS